MKKVQALLLYSSLNSSVDAYSFCGDRERQVGANCIPCPDFQRAQGSENENCHADVCDYTTQILLRNGKCETCSMCTVPSSDATFCEAGGQWAGQCPTKIQPPSPNCASNQILNQQNNCYTCPYPSYPNAAGSQCVQNPVQNFQYYTFCGANEIFDGYNCTPCGANQFPNNSFNACVEYQNNITCDLATQTYSTDGKYCITCPPYTRPQNNQSVCQADFCTANQVESYNGQCFTCTGGSYPDAARRHCVQPVQLQQVYYPNVTCGARQIYNSDGYGCLDCPAYTRAQDNNTFCAADPCNTFEVVGYEGYCELQCPSGTQQDQYGWGCVSIPMPTFVSYVTCNEYEILQPGGYCERCPMYTRAMNGNQYCGSDSCGPYDILSIEGRCAACPVGSSPDATYSRCIQEVTQPIVYQPVCNDRQIIDYGLNQCKNCPAYTRAQNQNFSCAPDNCPDDSKINFDGTCTQCPAGSISTGDQLDCMKLIPRAPVVTQTRPIAQCGPRQQMSSDGRACIDCADYTRAQNGNQMCTADPCFSYEIIAIDGTCARCPSNASPSANQRSCIQYIPDCGDRQRLSADQTTCIDCSPYTRAQYDNTVCDADACYSNQVVSIQGTCTNCPFGTSPGSDGRYCYSDVTCGPREILDYDGNFCVQCDPYTRAQNDNAFCSSDACTNTQIIMPDGTCAECPSYAYVSSDQRQCLSPSCVGREILESDGVCRSCPMYSYPDSERRNCISDTNCSSSDNERINQDGRCEKCPTGYRLTADNRFCELVVVAPQPKPQPAPRPVVIAPPPAPMQPTEGRRKDVALISIKPLDRLLNQRDQNDEIAVRVGCFNDGNDYDAKNYDFTLDQASINQETCVSNEDASNGCQADPEFVMCGPGQPYVVELFDRNKQTQQGLTQPPSIGQFKVTKQMMECMVENKLQVHFQFGKRESLSGAVTCFDHKDYITSGRRDGTMVQIQDEIPITSLNICQKQTSEEKNCFTYGYQVTLMVRDSERNPEATYPMLEPRIYAKINFNKVNTNLVVLPGDQVSLKFTSEDTYNHGLRITPDVGSPQMPSPFKERYQQTGTDGNPTVILPCNDMKVADTIACSNYEVYCTGPNDRITLSVQGKGDLYLLDQRCRDFFKNDQDWDALQAMLDSDVTSFNSQFQDDMGNMKSMKVSEVTLTNRFGVKMTTDSDFDLTYTFGWRFHSKQPECFAGDTLRISQPSCQFQCDSQQCLLDPASKSYVVANLPLQIPTKVLSLNEENVPQRLLDVFIKNTEGSGKAVRNVLAVEEVQEEKEEEAEMIQLSASFTNSGKGYEYDVNDLKNIEDAVPTYIQITQAPKHGNLVVKKFGQDVALNQGDFIETEHFKNFTYNQAGVSTSCGELHEERCKDAFSYRTFGQWVGQGNVQLTDIKLDPFKEEEKVNTRMFRAQEAGVAPIIPGETTNLEEAPSGKCDDSDPGAVLAVLGVFIVAMIAPLTFGAKKIQELRKEGSDLEFAPQTSEYASRDSNLELKKQSTSDKSQSLQLGPESIEEGIAKVEANGVEMKSMTDAIQK